MLLNAFSSIKIKVKFNPTVDNLVFKLHYRYTYVLFMGCVLLTTLYDWVGQKIECLITIDSDPMRDMVNSYCFIMGTFTIDRHKYTKEGEGIPYPGVGPQIDEEPITVHSYYQWVPFVLFFQGVLFYFPHWIWKGWEGGLFQNVIMDLSVKDYLGKDLDTYDKRSERFKKLAKYLKNHLNTHRSWAYKFFLCEFLNLFVTVFVFCFTNWFLLGQFDTYGTDVIRYVNMDPENRTDPMYMVFPRMAKCTFSMFGPSGTPQTVDAMCLIATNVVNEKIYLCIWIWLVFIMFVSSAWLLFRIFTILVPSLRYFILKKQASRAPASDVRMVMESANLSDWFLVHNLAMNMDRTVFSEFVGYLARELKADQENEGDSETAPLKREICSSEG